MRITVFSQTCSTLPFNIVELHPELKHSLGSWSPILELLAFSWFFLGSLGIKACIVLLDISGLFTIAKCLDLLRFKIRCTFIVNVHLNNEIEAVTISISNKV